MAVGPTTSATAASFRPPIQPPPPCFDYRTAVLADTRAAAGPVLAGLVESGALVRVPRRRFGPVPAWRPPDFEEPEEVWILGTSHLSLESIADVERVLRAVRPDNVVVELCRSRAGLMYVDSGCTDEPLLKSNMFSLGGAKCCQSKHQPGRITGIGSLRKGNNRRITRIASIWSILLT